MSKPVVYERDFHGLTVEQATQETERLINTMYMNRDKSYVVKLITGRGKIQRALMKYLQSMGVDPRIPMANTGVIVFSV